MGGQTERRLEKEKKRERELVIIVNRLRVGVGIAIHGNDAWSTDSRHMPDARICDMETFKRREQHKQDDMNDLMA